MRFMWAVLLASNCFGELERKRLCVPRNADNNIEYSDAIFRRNQADEKHTIEYQSKTWKLVCCARSLFFFFIALHPKMKYNPNFIAFYCYMPENLRWWCWWRWCEGESQRARERVSRRFDRAEEILALLIPGIKTIKYSRLLVSSFQIMRIACLLVHPRRAHNENELLQHLFFREMLEQHEEWSLNFSNMSETQFHPFFASLFKYRVYYEQQAAAATLTTCEGWKKNSENLDARETFGKVRKILLNWSERGGEWVSFDAEKNCRILRDSVLPWASPTPLSVSLWNLSFSSPKNQRWQQRHNRSMTKKKNVFSAERKGKYSLLAPLSVWIACFPPSRIIPSSFGREQICSLWVGGPCACCCEEKLWKMKMLSRSFSREIRYIFMFVACVLSIISIICFEKRITSTFRRRTPSFRRTHTRARKLLSHMWELRLPPSKKGEFVAGNRGSCASKWKEEISGSSNGRIISTNCVCMYRVDLKFHSCCFQFQRFDNVEI